MAQGGPKPSTFYVERQLATRSPIIPAPVTRNGNEWPLTSLCAAGRTDPGVGTTRSGDGLWLTGLTAISVRLYPNPGLTLTGGNLLAWLWAPWTDVWDRCPDLDLAVTTGTYTGPNGYLFASMSVADRSGNLMLYAASALTGSSNDFLLRIDGSQSVRPGTS